MQWTDEQLQAINEKGSNILVAAAAGSGKTAVLVERVINKIINEKIDIDKILIVTFTNLAAGQMKEKILDALYKKIEDEPENVDLQRQITLIPRASICTIDSFCLDIVKNNFFEIDISPNFRIADEIELKILKQETLEELFENKYEVNDKEFIELIDTYTSYKSDENLKNIILKIYNYIQSTPYPTQWLKEQVEKFNINQEIDYGLTQWGKILYENAKEDIVDSILQFQDMLNLAEKESLSKMTVILSEDVRKLQILNNSKNWDELYLKLQEFFFDRWSKDKEATEELNDEVKKRRDMIKVKIDGIKKEIIIYDSKLAIEDTTNMYKTMKQIENIVIEFINLLQKKKKEKNIVDFSDIEHFALDILIKDNKPTEVAKKYQEKFVEIAIDEYQDSNMIQEFILNTISKNNNIFMVGDVKQSIYKFRQARPELFLEKYNEYRLKEEKKDGDNLKIKLFKNFRSRKEVLDITNFIFQNIMSKEFGEIEYNKDEYLNIGAVDYKENNDITPEINIIDTIQDDEDTEDEHLESVVLEAKFVAKKINEIIKKGFLVSDKEKNLRPATYRDFAILLRSTKNIANIFEKELNLKNIPVFCDATSEYLTSYEIQIIMSLLKVIDNPHSDIPQITVLRSMIGNFNENELLEIRRNEKGKSFYTSMKEYCNCNEANEELKEKVNNYILKIDKWRKDASSLPLDEFIWKVYIETGFYNYVSLMQNGEYRLANLKMLFEKARSYEKTSFKGLFNFINFIDKLQISSGDMSGAKLIGENENVVRIMSIHKSKGLEFPIIFLCGTGKKFNIMDINQDDILLHNDLGLGPKFIDTNLNLKYDTLPKKAISIKMKQELIDEELRILYVALTRAKEKLIITGVENDFHKKMENKEMLLKCYDKYDEDKINKNILKRYMRYLDYFELILLRGKNVPKLLKLYVQNINEILKDDNIEEKSGRSIEEVLNNTEHDNSSIKEQLYWKYKYLTSTKIMSMTSVTEIKNKNKLAEMNNDISFDEPQFLREEIEISKAKIGTLTHLVLQNLNEKEDYTYEKLNELINRMISKGTLTLKESKFINLDKIYKFTNSNIFKQLKNAKKVYKEQPFYMYVPAKLVYDEQIDENILIQGIIDLCYIDKDDRLIIVDYKTDYVESRDEQILLDRYKVQLELYKNAIEKSLNKKVSKIYIYSTYLEKSINIL